jgi:hypothetical protein
VTLGDAVPNHRDIVQRKVCSRNAYEDVPLADRRIFPAIDVKRSGTRREELLFTEDELRRVWQLRRLLNSLETDRAAEVLLSGLQKSNANKDFDRAYEILRAVIAAHPLNVLPVEVLCPLPIRVTRVFVAAEDVSASLATLVQCVPTNMHWREFGPTSLARLGERMRALGLNLAGQRDYAWIKLPKRSKPVTGALNRVLILPTFVTSAAGDS